MLRLIILFLFLPFSVYPQEYDLLIRNGRIADGTGNSWYLGDIAIKDGKIAAIGRSLSGSAHRIIDAGRRIVAPGFIDVHAHIEESVFKRPYADNFIFDGVTTVVTGNCGSSAVDIARFFAGIDSMKTTINVASLVGHNSIRAAVMGRDNRAATPEEIMKMQELIEKAMKDGAVGFSTGLIYVPGTYANTDEVIALARSAAKYNGLYASHIRNEESKVTEAIEEALSVGREANMPVEISHFKVGGKANWGRSHETLAMIEKARSEGWDVTIDQYPYTASSTNLGVRLPNWAVAGTQDSINRRLQDPVLRKKITKEMLEEIHRYKFKNYRFAVVASYAADSSYNGKSISEINRLMGRRPKARLEAETILDMMQKGGAAMVYHSMNENDVRYIMKYPFAMIGADAGIPVPGKSMPHPRGYGTNAKILGQYVREEKLVPLEEMIRRMTSLAAQKFQLKNRGLLKEGYAADVVIFDDKEVQDKATYENPHQLSRGFYYVLVNGQPVIDNGMLTGIRSGQPLTGPGYAKQ